MPTTENRTNNVQINSNDIVELINHAKLLRKARLRVWDIMFTNIVSTQFPECRQELETAAQSLTNALAILDSTVKSQNKTAGKTDEAKS